MKKRWRSIPVGVAMVLMALVLIAGSALAAFNFAGFASEAYVDEPLSIGYNLQEGTLGWQDSGDNHPFAPFRWRWRGGPPHHSFEG